MASIKLDFNELNRNIGKIKTINNFCILGTEDFQKNEALKIILKTHNVAEFDGFDSFLAYGDNYSTKENSINTIIEQLNMLSFIQEKKTVVLKNYENLNIDNQDQITKYLANPSPDNLFIFSVDKLDARKSSTKAIFNSCMVIECKEIRYQNVLARWLDEEIRARGLIFDNIARNTFLNSIELDYYVASNELSKLELYIGNRKHVTNEDVLNCTAFSKTYSIFELLDEIGYKNAQKAILIADNLLENDVNQIMIIAMITNFFFTLWNLSAVMQKNISPNELKMRYMPEIHPTFRDKYINFLKNYSLKNIKNAIEILLQTDRQIKLSMASDFVLIETMIYKIIKNKDN